MHESSLLRHQYDAETCLSRVLIRTGNGSINSWARTCSNRRWTTIGNGRAWTPVTRNGIDVVVAGTTAEHFVILLALGDD